MSDDAKKKPGPDPERLVIEGDSGEELRRRLASKEDRANAKRTKAGGWVDFKRCCEPYGMPLGRYEAIVRLEFKSAPREEPTELHRRWDGWQRPNRTPVPEKLECILRVRWLGELPD